MSTYTATIRWSREAEAEDFGKGQYSGASNCRHPELVSGSIFVKGCVRLRNGC
jgi:hypothetical protein